MEGNQDAMHAFYMLQWSILSRGIYIQHHESHAFRTLVNLAWMNISRVGGKGEDEEQEEEGGRVGRGVVGVRGGGQMYVNSLLCFSKQVKL